METSFKERVERAMAEVSSITPEKAWQLHEQDPDVVFVDPRDAEAIRTTTGIIPGAINVPLGQITDGRPLPDRLGHGERRLVTSCQAGPMGALAAQALKRLGFSDIAFVQGGTQAWVDAGYPTSQ